MSAEIRYDGDADLSLIQSRRVAVIGDGGIHGCGQGHAHALSLRDSGVDVRVGLSEQYSNSRAAAADEGMPVLTPAEAAADADVIMVLTPDAVYRQHFAADIAPNLHEGDALLLGRGFNVRHGLVTPPSTVDVALVAAKAPGGLVRRQFVDGKGVPCLVAVHADVTGNAWPLALSYAKAIGCTRAGAILTTFAEETDAGLFGEQAVLCGGLTALVQAGFDVLTEAGHSPEVAYFASLHELKLVVDRMYEGGLTGMWHSVSDTARYGGLTRGQRVISSAVKDDLRKILAEITDGSFAREWFAEDDAGRPNLGRLTAEAERHDIEHVGRTLRALMSWLQ